MESSKQEPRHTLHWRVCKRNQRWDFGNGWYRIARNKFEAEQLGSIKAVISS